MDSWGIGIFVIGVLLSVATWKSEKRGWHRVGLLTAGAGLGIVIGAVWAMQIVNGVIDGMF